MELKRLFWRAIVEYDKMRKTSWTLIEKGHLVFSGIKFGRNLHVNGHLYIYNRGTVEIGNNVTINSSVWSNPIGGGRTYMLTNISGRAYKNRKQCWNL